MCADLEVLSIFKLPTQKFFTENKTRTKAA